jgi:hypothetical protein
MKQVYWKQIQLNKKEKQVIEKFIPHSIFDFQLELNGFELNRVVKTVKDPDVKGAKKSSLHKK